jgi:hypothetical protein
VKESEVAHGTSGGADVERISRGYENDTKMIEFGAGCQGVILEEI